MARTFQVNYGGYVVGLSGDDSEVKPTDKFRMDQDYTTVSCTFEVIVLGASASAFQSAEAALIAAFTKPDQALTVTLGGSTRLTFDPSSNTGFNAQPGIEKLGGVEDTDRSARYRITVAMGLPADLSGKDGRQSSSVAVTVDPAGIKTVTLSGVYTALSSNSARAQFESAIATYVAAVKSTLSITDWELVGRPTEEDDDNGKVLRFSRVYRELIHNQGIGTVDVAGIVNDRLRIRRNDGATNDTTELGQTEPLRSLSLSYTCFVDRGTSTDLDGFYESTIRPHLINQATDIAGTGVIVTDETPTFDIAANRVYVDMRLEADTGTGLLAATVETEDIVSSGEVRFVLWDGNPFRRDVYQGPQSHVRRRRKSILRRSGLSNTIADDVPAGFRENSLVRKVQTRTLGRTTDSTLDLEFVVISQEFERVDLAPTAQVAVRAAKLLDLVT